MNRALRLMVLLICFGTWTPAGAEVLLPNGEYTETNQDLSVKVLGGYVTIARTWTNGRWYINPCAPQIFAPRFSRRLIRLSRQAMA
jgi:hypothetical protein